MLTAIMQLISGNVGIGLILAALILICSASYILLTRGGSKYPTNLCVVGCILCGIITDVIWSLFSFSATPLLGSEFVATPLDKLFYEFTTAASIYFSGLIITNLARIKKYRKAKLALYIFYVILSSVLVLNIISFRPIEFHFVLPGLTFKATNIILICLENIVTLILGGMALAGRGAKSRINIATAIVLGTLILAAGAGEIYRYSTLENDFAKIEYTSAAEYNTQSED